MLRFFFVLCYGFIRLRSPGVCVAVQAPARQRNTVSSICVTTQTSRRRAERALCVLASTSIPLNSLAKACTPRWSPSCVGARTQLPSRTPDADDAMLIARARRFSVNPHQAEGLPHLCAGTPGPFQTSSTVDPGGHRPVRSGPTVDEPYHEPFCGVRAPISRSMSSDATQTSN